MVWIHNTNRLDDHKKEIIEYEKKNEQYRIVIDFFTHNTNLDFKMRVVNMIDELNVNHRVGVIRIGFHIDNVINEEIIRIMIKRY